jgi:prepilin-type processing-associated H-X9-DG protein
MPFLAKNAKMNFEVGTDRLAFEEARKSVLWGCTEWEGWRQGHPGAPSTYVNGVSIFESGYAMNMWPTYKARYPVASNAKPPVREGQARSTAIGIVGKYHKRSQWTQPSERLLMVDSTLWLLGFGPTVGQILPQSVGRVSQDGQGQTNIDRYRHGKYPAITSIGYARTGGRVSFNVLYVDGHASTLKDIREGYKAIRMRYPGPT